MSIAYTRLLAVLLVISLTLSGCKTLETKIASMDTCDWVGTGVGAVAGGVAGGAMLGGKEGYILGAMVGGFVGNKIASMLDCHDKKAAATAGVAAAEEPVGKTVVWSSQGAKVELDKVPGRAVTKVSSKTAAEGNVSGSAAAPTKTAAKTSEKTAAKTSSKTGTKTAGKAGTATDAAPVASKEEVLVAKTSAKVPIVSEGSSGSWGYSRPLTALARTQDGRMCRNVEHVVFDAKGTQNAAVGTSCLDAENRWVIT